MDFGNLISRSFEIAWRHKSLWIFGLFVGGASYLNMDFDEFFRYEVRDIPDFSDLDPDEPTVRIKRYREFNYAAREDQQDHERRGTWVLPKVETLFNLARRACWIKGTMPEEGGDCPEALITVTSGIMQSDDDGPRTEEE